MSMTQFTNIDNPTVGQETVSNGKTYRYDGFGWVIKITPPEPFVETDPIYNADKNTLALKADIPDLSAYAKTQDLSAYAKTQDLPTSLSVITDTIYRSDAIWDKDNIRLKQTPLMYDVKRLLVRTSYGDLNPACKIVYGNGYAWLKSPALSKNENWEFFIIDYNLVTNNKTYLPDLRGRIGLNFMQDEEAGQTYHSWFNCEIFRSLYEALVGISNVKRQALESLKVAGSAISQENTDELAVIHKFNILARPYGNAAVSEEYSSCPDILTVASHYGNYYYEGAIGANQHGILNQNTSLNVGARKDITSGADIFLKNTIAITAGENSDGTGIWCTYGFGVEFFESMRELAVRYPYKNFYSALFGMFVESDKRTIITTTEGGKRHTVDNGTGINSRYVGETLWLHYGTQKIEFKVSEIIDNYTIKSDRDLLPINTNLYVWGYINVFETMKTGNPQQSMTCSLIAAKLAAIQDLTGANWQLVREAARMTASNSTFVVINNKKVYTTHWDIKRGFGIIDIDKATEYIRDNYLENIDYIDNILTDTPQVNSLLKFENLGENDLISKKMLINYISSLNSF